MVGAWKGFTKPMARAGIALTAFAALFHYLRVGPNDTTKDERRRPRAELEKNHG